MTLTPAVLKALLRAASRTRPDEIGCDECYRELDRFAELTLAGLGADEALPLVADHLARCGNCREEFEGLLEGLRALRPARRSFFRLRP
jgi:hypothetical protein